MLLSASFLVAVLSCIDGTRSAVLDNVRYGKPLDKLYDLPFKRMVVFGDDYSDNGNGSFAYGVTGNLKTGKGKHLWGHNTWTNGPIYATYLSSILSVPITHSYAFGSSGLGSSIGSVCNASAVPTPQTDDYAKLTDGRLVPDLLAQVGNYSHNSAIAAAHEAIGDTLHIVWSGNNDMVPALVGTKEHGRFSICGRRREGSETHSSGNSSSSSSTQKDQNADGSLNATLCVASQGAFERELNHCLMAAIMGLVAKGAKYILVPSILPRQLMPWTRMWVTQDGEALRDFGRVIDAVNANIRENVARLNKEYYTKIMYYDAGAWLQMALRNPAAVGIDVDAVSFRDVEAGRDTPGHVQTCVDGCPGTVREAAMRGRTNFDVYMQRTVKGGRDDEFFWMTETGMSAVVHRALAWDIARFLREEEGRTA